MGILMESLTINGKDSVTVSTNFVSFLTYSQNMQFTRISKYHFNYVDINMILNLMSPQINFHLALICFSKYLYQNQE